MPEAMTDPPAPHDTAELLKSLGTALGLGLLVGLQREWVRDRVAGIRTFALVGLFGGLAGVIGQLHGSWAIAAALLACAAIVISGNQVALREENPDAGMTTEIAVLVMFAIGVVAVMGHRLIAVTCAGTMMVLLESKEPLHGMVRRIGGSDLREIARLVLAGLVILPLLPNREIGYLGVLNPFKAWLMVVLIIGVSLAAYLIGKFVGGSRGTVVAGILGGLISSTATTAGIARRSKAAGTVGPSLAAITLTASAVVFVRVLGEVLLVAPGHWRGMLPPLAAMMVWCALVAVVAQRRAAKSGAPQGEEATPSELKGAVMFGLLYVAVLYGVALAKQHFGDAGLYVVAAVSGLTDMDAITLSTAGLVADGHVAAEVGWRVILLGGLANLLFKAGLVVVLGARAFVRPVLAGMGAALLGGGAILAFWP
jgi:uncharacterized membrane protein (DUF4010 family)